MFKSFCSHHRVKSYYSLWYYLLYNRNFWSFRFKHTSFYLCLPLGFYAYFSRICFFPHTPSLALIWTWLGALFGLLCYSTGDSSLLSSPVVVWCHLILLLQDCTVPSTGISLCKVYNCTLEQDSSFDLLIIVCDMWGSMGMCVPWDM